MQMLVPPSRRKKVITPKEIEAVVATIARIPPKSVSADDKQVLEHLEADLKRVVFGQAWRSRSSPRRSSCRARGFAIPTSRSATIFSPARPASARPRSRARLASIMELPCASI